MTRGIAEVPQGRLNFSLVQISFSIGPIWTAHEAFADPRSLRKPSSGGGASREMAQMCALCALGLLPEEFFECVGFFFCRFGVFVIGGGANSKIPDVSFHREGAVPRRNGAAKGALDACSATLVPGGSRERLVSKRTGRIWGWLHDSALRLRICFRRERTHCLDTDLQGKVLSSVKMIERGGAVSSFRATGTSGRRAFSASQGFANE
jgi:hypothetical protein